MLYLSTDGKDWQEVKGLNILEKKELLTLKEAAEKLKVSHRTMYRYIKNGIIKPIRYTPNGMYRFDPSDLEQLVNSSKHN